MNPVQAFILAVVEGVTEFLPISSTGHMILAARLMNLNQGEFIKSFEIFIQLGAILAVVVLYGQRIINRREENKKILAAFVPTAIIGFLLYKLVKQYLLGNSLVTIISLFVGGLLMILFEKYEYRNPKYLRFTSETIKNIKLLNYKQAAAIGVFQAIAVVPGVSRSLMTIIGGMLMGLSRQEAVEMSFLLAIPTMTAAVGLDIVKSGWGFTKGEWGLLVLGFMGAFITALVVVKWFVNFVQKHNFVGFGIYRMLLALIFIFLGIK